MLKPQIFNTYRDFKGNAFRHIKIPQVVKYFRIAKRLNKKISPYEVIAPMMR